MWGSQSIRATAPTPMSTITVWRNIVELRFIMVVLPGFQWYPLKTREKSTLSSWRLFHDLASSLLLPIGFREAIDGAKNGPKSTPLRSRKDLNCLCLHLNLVLIVCQYIFIV